MGILPGAEEGDQEVFLENYLNTSITRNSDGSYTAKFPWNEDAPPLPLELFKLHKAHKSHGPSPCTRLTHPISLKPTMTYSRRWKCELL